MTMTNPNPACRLAPTIAAVVASGLGLFLAGCLTASSASSNALSTPVLDVLPQFTAAGVPALGPKEVAINPPGWKVSPPDTSLPGGGALARHAMLFVGEGCNKMFLVNGGKVVWTYSTGKGGEFDDVWLLSNGDILFSRMAYAEEVTPQKQVVWHLDAPKGSEIHTVQPIGLDKVLLMENGTPARLLVINKKTGVTEVDHALPDAGASVHPQFRRVRLTAAGTYLVPYLEANKVVEFDQSFNVIWTYQVTSPWAAVRLHNGNTLITDEKDKLTREVNPKGETVWEFKLAADLPPEIKFPNSQTCLRLANGNTILCSTGANGQACQLLEVTPEKKIAWALKDWTDLGPATALQVLEDPGVPEHPGDLQR
jgi:hypothetical protein